MYMENNTDKKMHPQFFFISLGVLVSLITVMVSFLQMLFAILEKKFPDALNAVYTYGYNGYDTEGIRTSLAVLIIVFPTLMVLSYIWTRLQNTKLGTIDLYIRKWMIYLILFIASIVILVDLITLVRYFVAGEITIRFIYKVLVTLGSATLVGGYYIHELQEIFKYRKVYVGIATLSVICAIVFSFFVIGSPKEQRMWRMDERRIQDMQTIQWQVVNFWQQKKILPKTLGEMVNPLSGVTIPLDPEFQKGLVYEYTSKGPLSFEVCATFSLPRIEGLIENQNMYTGGKDIAISRPVGFGNDSWAHEGGSACFARTIDTDIFPPIPQDAE